MLTERAKIVLFFLGVSLLIAFYTQVEIIFFIAGLLASLLLVSFILFRLTQVIMFDCSRQLPAAVYEDETVTVTLTVENRSRFDAYFFFLSLQDTFPAERDGRQQKNVLFSFLPRHATARATYEGYCLKRGTYWVGPFLLTTSDPLGFFRKRKIINISSKLTVYPRIFSIHELASFNKGVVSPRYGSKTTRRSGDYEEFFGIREYHQEDGLRKIHWPSSAKHSQLMVRHFEQTGANSATIILDLKYGNNIGKEKETTLEYSVKIAGSLAKYFLDQGFLVQVLAYGDKPLITSLGKDPSHFSNILELLAQAEDNSPLNLSEALSRLHYFIPQNSTIAVIRLDRDTEAARAVEQLIYTKSVSVFDIQLVSSSFDEALPPYHLYFMQASGSEVISYPVRCHDDLEYQFIGK
jgi:uncharacterized protein (DUF58 family)